MSRYPKFTNLLRIVDDVAVYGETEAELLTQFSILLYICSENHFTLSLKMFQFTDPDGSIKFAGMILSSRGLLPDPFKPSAIQDFMILNSKMSLHL